PAPLAATRFEDLSDLSRVRRVVLSHHLSDALQADVSSQAFLSGTVRALLRGRAAQTGDVRCARRLESLQRRLELQLEITTARGDLVALEIVKVRAIAAQQLRDARTVTFDLQIGKMPRLLHPREETVDATTQPIDRNGRERRAQLAGKLRE